MDAKIKRLVLLSLTLAVLITLGACGQFGGGTAPDDMSAEEHRRHSDEHQTRARDHEDRYDPDVLVEAYPGAPGWGDEYANRYRGDYYWDDRSYNPTARHLAHANRHEGHAREHLAAAQALEQFEEAQCRSFPPETRAVCPLIDQVAAVEDIEGGSRIRFVDGVDVNAAVAHLRCHLAFARSQARSGMETCPLYLEDVQILRVGIGPEVDLVTGQRGDVADLRSRLHDHVAP